MSDKDENDVNPCGYLVQLKTSQLEGCTDIFKIECHSNKVQEKPVVKEDGDQTTRPPRNLDGIPPFYERMDYSNSIPNSVACQTEWSWLAAYRAIQWKFPQKPSSAKSRSVASTVDGETEEVDEVSPFAFGDHGDDLTASELLKTYPWPSKEDEYGIPLDDSNEEELEQSEEEEEDEDEESLEQLLHGICPFCGKQKKPFPSLEDQETKSPEELYCCSAFREFITERVTETGELRAKYRKRQRFNADYLTGRKKHKKKKKKKKKKKGKRDESSETDDLSASQQDNQEGRQWRPGSRPRSASRSGSRRGSKSRESGSRPGSGSRSRSGSRPGSRLDSGRGSGRLTADSDRPCIVYGREMTTINYQLSSRQCMRWTVGLSSGAICEQKFPEAVNVVEPVQHQGRPSFDADASLLCQTYDNGMPFLVIFSDGSGNVFYPNGRIAVTIIASKLSDYTYIVQDTNGQLLGIYESNGRTVTYHRNGSIWVSTDADGGLDLDSEGNRRKKWSWNDTNHNHAPPLFSITCSMSPTFTFSISSKSDMTLLFEKSRRACRFNVGANPQQKISHKKKSCGPVADILDIYESYIKKIKLQINEVLQKTSILLKLPSSPRLDGTLSPVKMPNKRRTPVCQRLRRESKVLPAINH